MKAVRKAFARFDRGVGSGCLLGAPGATRPRLSELAEEVSVSKRTLRREKSIY